MATLTQTSVRGSGMTSEEKFVIFASSLGTVFEWYDFYLYAVLAPFFSAVFFPPGSNTAALLSAFATYAAGFLVRPFGALIFAASAISSAASIPFSSPSWSWARPLFSSACCHLCADWRDRADPAGDTAALPGSGARRRVRRRGDLCRRALAPVTSEDTHQLRSRRPRHWASSWRSS